MKVMDEPLSDGLESAGVPGLFPPGVVLDAGMVQEFPASAANLGVDLGISDLIRPNQVIHLGVPAQVQLPPFSEKHRVEAVLIGKTNDGFEAVNVIQHGLSEAIASPAIEVDHQDAGIEIGSGLALGIFHAGEWEFGPNRA